MKNIQIHETEDINTNTKTHKIFSNVMKWIGIGILVFCAIFYGFVMRYFMVGIVFVICSIAMYYLHDIVWSISDKIRDAVMPRAYLADSASDAMRQKIFWNIGPQSFGWFFLFVILLQIGMYLVPEDKPNEISNKSAANVIGGTITIPEKPTINPIPERYRGKWFVDGFMSKVKCNSNPVVIEDTKYSFGQIQGTLVEKESHLVNQSGDKFEYNSDGTLTLITIADPNNKIILTRCPI